MNFYRIHLFLLGLSLLFTACNSNPSETEEAGPQEKKPSEISDSPYGFCLNSFVALRGETSDSSELVSQLVFGDAFHILKDSLVEAEKWIYIQNHFDSYEGWIHEAQALAIDENYYRSYQAENHPVSIDPEAFILKGTQKIKVPLGSTLPFFQNDAIRVGSQKFSYQGRPQLAQSFTREGIIPTAKLYLKSPYLWGGKTPEGLDCSGFTQTVMKINGFHLPRDSYQQAEIGDSISYAEAKAGDLVFFQKVPLEQEIARVSHVGIVLEEGKLIHAFDEVQIDNFDERGIYRLNEKQQTEYLRFTKFIRRLK